MIGNDYVSQANPSYMDFSPIYIFSYTLSYILLQWDSHPGRDSLTIYITKAASFALFGVMKTTGPIDGYVAFLSVEARGTLHTAACADATELE